MAKSRSRFNQHLALAEEAPNKEHIQRLMESEEARELLKQALDKSAELVASLETKIVSLTEERDRVRQWWQNSETNAKSWRDAYEDLKRENASLRQEKSAHEAERRTLMPRVFRMEGWINATRGLDPSGNDREKHCHLAQTDEVQRAEKDYAFMDKRGR